MATAAAKRAAEADIKRQQAKTTATKKKPSATKKKAQSNKHEAQETATNAKAKTDDRKIGLDELIATRINEREGYTTIVGEARADNRIWIAEKMKTYKIGAARYRLKAVTYFYFSTRDALETFCNSKKIPIDISGK